MPLISKSEFARRIGVSPAAVGMACRSGRLDTINGRLDEKTAPIQWEARRRRDAPIPVPKINWLVENTAVWITLRDNHAALPSMVQYWLECAAGSPVNPILAERLISLLNEISNCVDRIEKPV